MAAGQGRRFGSDKRHHRFADGRTLLGTTLAAVLPAYPRAYLLTRPGESLETLEIDERAGVDAGRAGRAGPGDEGHTTSRLTRLECIAAPAAERGLAGTLGDAFRHLLDNEEPACAAAVVLADMPWLTADICRRLSAQAQAGRIVIPRHRGRGGHPVVFGRDFWKALAALHQGEGAREIVSRHAEACHYVDVETPAIWRDVDRPGDLQ